MKVGHCQAPNPDPRSPSDRGFFFYRIAAASADAHRFVVTLRLAGGDGGARRLAFAAWIPGSYLIRDFARNVLVIRGAREGDPVALVKVDKQTWEMPAGPGVAEVCYEVYARDLSVRSAYLDRSRAYFNGTSLLLRVLGEEETPCIIEMIAPDAAYAQTWSVATTLPPERVDGRGFGTYRAESYWDAIDHPVEWAAHSTVAFDVDGVPHGIALSGPAAGADLHRLAADLERVCRHHAKLFGILPVPRYLFLMHATGDGYGGLEHAHSSSLVISRDDLPLRGEEDVSDGYRRLLGLCSHEYFHLWNVKRIRPACFTRPDLDGEVHTTLLWAFEGITSYYDDLMLVRSGCITGQSYLELLARNISRLLRTPGRRIQSIAEASFDAWTRLYKPDENSPNAGVSYYLKGGLVAWGLDAELRLATQDRATLDDLMRALWSHFGSGEEGLREGDIERVAANLAGPDLGSFFERYVYGTDELPLASWCEAFGLGLRLRPSKDEQDEGGALSNAPPDTPVARSWLGARVRSGGEGVALAYVFAGGAAERAGLSPGDVLVAIDGRRTTAEALAKRLRRAAPGDRLAVHAFRGDLLHEFEVELESAPADTCDIWPAADDAAPLALRARRARWLDGG